MTERAKGIGLGLARVGAVVLAIGALGYFVITAQQNAQSSEPERAPTDNDLPFEESFGEQEGSSDKPVFMPSTKSGIGLGTPPGEPFGERKQPAEAKPKKDHFLPSSKSLPLPPDLVKGEKKAPDKKPAPKKSKKRKW